MRKIYQKFKSMSDGVKSSIVFTLSSLFTRGLAIITVPLFTRLMTPAEIGMVNLYNSWYSMISVVSTLALTSGGFLLALKEFKDERDEYVSSVLSLTTLIALFFGIVYIFSPSFWNKLTGLPTSLMVLMIFELILSPAQVFWISRQRYEYKYKAVALLSFSSAFFASLLSIIIVLYGNQNGIGNLAVLRLYANYFVLLSVALGVMISIFKKGKSFFNKKYWLFSLSLSIPLIGHSIASQILTVSDRTMISKMIDNSAVGIYSTLYTVSSLSLIVWQAINTSFIPFLFENIGVAEKKQDIKNLASQLLTLFAVVAFVLTIMAPEVVAILATSEYYSAIYIMPPICAGVFLTSVSNMYTNLLIYHKKTNFIMISTIVAALSNVVLNYIFIQKFGYMAASYTTLFSYIILAIMQCLVSNNVHKKIVKCNEDVYDTKYMLLLSTVTILACLLCVFIYNLTLIRYLLIVVIFIIAIVNRKRIILMIQRKK